MCCPEQSTARAYAPLEVTVYLSWTVPSETAVGAIGNDTVVVESDADSEDIRLDL
jgi:hypothetical protein